MTTPSAFGSLLAPLDQEEFFDRYWEREPLVLRGHRSRLGFSFSRADFFTVALDCDVVKASFQNELGEHRDVRIPPERAAEGFERGFSICVSQMETGSPEIHGLVRDLNAGLRQLGEFRVNGYLSPHDQGFGLHFDNHSVWIVQLEGRKRWRYSRRPGIEYPLDNTILPSGASGMDLRWYRVERPDEAVFLEETLGPGDLLYLPAGTWHRTCAGEHSLALTLAQEMTPAARFVGDLMRDRQLRSLAGRRFLPVVPATRASTEAKGEALHAFEECLASMRAALAAMTPEGLYREWRAEIACRRARDRRPARGPDARVPWER